jgi:urate oxidase
MSAELIQDSYGKTRVRVSRVTRHGDRHDFVELTVDTRLEGDFGAAFVSGDNSRILPTDSQKNAVHALASHYPLDPIEGFAEGLAGYFLSASPAIGAVRIGIGQRRWQRLEIGGKAHPFAFSLAGEEQRICELYTSRNEGMAFSGLQNLVLLKTTHSSFKGFFKDRFTTLPDADDRIFATSVAARWRYGARPTDFNKAHESVRAAIIETFAREFSPSVQHTLYAMAQKILDARPEIAEVNLTLPNVHHLPVDVRRLGMEERQEVFQPTNEPHGIIEATVRRGG